MIWFKALTRPTERGYAILLTERNITLWRGVIWLIAASVVAAIISWQIEPGYFGQDPRTGSYFFNPGLDIGVLVGGLVQFVTSVAVIHFLALRIGGRGPLAQMAFLAASYQSPLVLLWGVLAGPASTLTALMQCGNPLLSLIALSMSVNAARAAYQIRFPKALFCAAIAFIGAYFVNWGMALILMPNASIPLPGVVPV